MSPRTSVTMLASLLAALALPAPPAAACDSSSCLLVTRGETGGLRKGAFSVDLSFGYSDEGKRLAGSSSTDDVVLPRIDFDGRQVLPGFHRELDGSLDSLQAYVAYGITPRLSAFVSLPLFTRKRFEHVHLPVPPPTDPAEPPADDPHGHGPAPEGVPQPREYRTDGFGDTLLGVRYAFLGGPHRLSAGVALQLPTGESRVPNTFDGGLQDPMLQPGTGSFDVVLSGQYVRGQGPLQVALSGSQQITTTNDLGYRFGQETIVAVGLTRTLRSVYSRALISTSIQVKAHVRGRSAYLGEAVPSTGARMILLSPGLRVTLPGGMGFYTFLQLPVYRHVNEAQLITRSSLLAGVSKSF